VWDLRTGAVARSLESKGAVTSIEVTPCGRYIVTADGKQVDFRDAASFDLLKSHVVEGYLVESASYAPEKGKFVAGGSDMWVRLHDYETGQELEVCKGERPVWLHVPCSTAVFMYVCKGEALAAFVLLRCMSIVLLRFPLISAGSPGCALRAAGGSGLVC
jgi:hypothetical protein